MGGCCSSTSTPLGVLESAPLDAPRYERRSGVISARLADVYDGDTFTALIVVEGVAYRRRCRCIGYDAPEMRGKNADKPAAIAARDYLANLIPAGVFDLELCGTEKYGRLLVNIKVNEESLKDHMVRMGHGYYYDGGTKKTSSE